VSPAPVADDSKSLYNLPDNPMLMKTHISLLLIAVLLLLAGQAGASFWFKVIDVTPIEMSPNSEANFTASVKGLGSERAYVQLVFNNSNEGLTIYCPKKIKNVFPQGVTQYNCTTRAEGVAPGNYSFVVDVAAAGAPSGKMTAFINVIGPESDVAIEPEGGNQTAAEISAKPQADATQTAAETPAKPQAKGTPAPGAMAAVLALLLVLRRMKI
jgi:hypothetical protein